MRDLREAHAIRKIRLLSIASRKSQSRFRVSAFIGVISERYGRGKKEIRRFFIWRFDADGSYLIFDHTGN